MVMPATIGVLSLLSFLLIWQFVGYPVLMAMVATFARGEEERYVGLKRCCERQRAQEDGSPLRVCLRGTSANTGFAASFYLAQLSSATSLMPRTRKGKVTLVFSEYAVSFLGKFRTNSRFERATSLLLLVLRGKVRIRFSSGRSFCEVARKGGAIVGSL